MNTVQILLHSYLHSSARSSTLANATDIAPTITTCLRLPTAPARHISHLLLGESAFFAGLRDKKGLCTKISLAIRHKNRRHLGVSSTSQSLVPAPVPAYTSAEPHDPHPVLQCSDQRWWVQRHPYAPRAPYAHALMILNPRRHRRL